MLSIFFAKKIQQYHYYFGGSDRPIELFTFMMPLCIYKMKKVT